MRLLSVHTVVAAVLEVARNGVRRQLQILNSRRLAVRHCGRVTHKILTETAAAVVIAVHFCRRCCRVDRRGGDGGRCQGLVGHADVLRRSLRVERSVRRPATR